MTTIRRRVSKLQDHFAINSSGKLRVCAVIISLRWKGLPNWLTSKCQRRCGDPLGKEVVQSGGK